MDAKKILEALDIYVAKLKLFNFGEAELRPERADPTKKYNSVSPGSAITKMNHTWWAIGQCREFVEAGRMEKAFRWLGFIQGTFWTLGIYSIEELANHNKPAGEETNLDSHGAVQTAMVEVGFLEEILEALSVGPDGVGPNDYAFTVTKLRTALGK